MLSNGGCKREAKSKERSNGSRSTCMYAVAVPAQLRFQAQLPLKRCGCSCERDCSATAARAQDSAHVRIMRGGSFTYDANASVAVTHAAKYFCKLCSACSRSRDHRKRIANSCDAKKVQLQVTTESFEDQVSVALPKPYRNLAK